MDAAGQVGSDVPGAATATGTEEEPEASGTPAPTTESTRRPRSRVRRAFMRPRRQLVFLHRWLAIGLMAWLVVIGLTGAWLAERHQLDAWFHPGRYDASSGDVGPQEAVEAATDQMPDDAHVYGLTMPRNARGVYKVWAEQETPAETKGGEPTYSYFAAFVDPGNGDVNSVVDDAGGFGQWLYRGHMYLWQDYGVFGAFDPQTGWCRADASGNEPGGVKGVVCDVIPSGDDMVAWFAVGWLVVLFGGFYLWYWPGVKRWANALRVQRGRGPFTLNMSLHKVIGLVFFVPLTVIAFTGMAFAFPNLKSWYQNVTPAPRGLDLWVAPDDAYQSEKPAGRDPLTYDEALSTIEESFPHRTVQYLGGPHDGEKRGVYEAWTTRGFDPWTREGGAGNAYVLLDQYTGKVLADETPEEGNVFSQAWDDWSFPLHAGDFGGPITRALWVLVGLAPLVLGVTGITMYVIRRRKRSRSKARGERPSVVVAEGGDPLDDQDAAVDRVRPPPAHGVDGGDDGTRPEPDRAPVG